MLSLLAWAAEVKAPLSVLLLFCEQFKTQTKKNPAQTVNI